MRQTILDAFERYRLYVLGGVGVVVVAIITAVILSTTGGNGGGQDIPPTDTPRATRRVMATNVFEASPAPATATPDLAPTDEPQARPTQDPTPMEPSPTDRPQATPTPVLTNTPVPGQTLTPEPLSITIVSPEQGENVGSTFMVEIAVTGVGLELGPGGQLIPGAGHWHVALDTAPPLPEQHDELTVQFGPVEMGLHTITVLLYLNEADLTVVAIDQVQITITDESSSPPTPST